MVSDLSKNFGKTFIGEVICRIVDTCEIVYRYFDIRVVVLNHLFQIIHKQLVNASKLKIYVWEYVKWNDSRYSILAKWNIYRNSESDLNFLRNVLLISYSWQGTIQPIQKF